MTKTDPNILQERISPHQEQSLNRASMVIVFGAVAFSGAIVGFVIGFLLK